MVIFFFHLLTGLLLEGDFIVPVKQYRALKSLGSQAAYSAFNQVAWAGRNTDVEFFP
jgi:hypothetical protein